MNPEVMRELPTKAERLNMIVPFGTHHTSMFEGAS